MKLVKMYCPKCEKKTLHSVYKEDCCGAKGIGRLITAAITVGMSLITTDTIAKCTECEHEQDLD